MTSLNNGGGARTAPTAIGYGRLSTEDPDTLEEAVASLEGEVKSDAARSGDVELPRRMQDPEQPVKIVEAPAAPDQARPADEVPLLWGIPLKWLSLLTLTLQTTLQVFAIKAARWSSKNYMNSTVVLFSETSKFILSVCLLATEEGDIPSALRALYGYSSKSYIDTLKVGVPALLYTIQNNLTFYSLDKLSMAVQQVTYQLKILTAGVLSVLILGKVLGPTKWAALFGLVGGVALVQYPRDAGVAHVTTSPPPGGLAQQQTEGQPLVTFDPEAFKGFLAVLGACFMSGFAGVYIEKILKQSSASIWMKNAQLAMFGSVMALSAALSQDGERIRHNGFAHGWTPAVAFAGLAMASGGLLVAVVLKYADNILRNFSTALSIVLTSSLDWLVLGGFVPDSLFIIGTLLTIGATFLYNLGMPQFLQDLLTAMQSKGRTQHIASWLTS